MLARSLATAGYVWWLLDPERSAALFEEGLAAAQRGGDDWTRSTGLAGLGWARYYAGRFDAAIGPLQDAIQLTARSGRRQQFGMAVLGRAAVELWLGRLATAEASAQQALDVLRAIGDATWTSAALAIVAEIERTRGRLDAAGHHAVEAIEVAGRANSAINVMIATGHLGRILLARGEPGLPPTSIRPCSWPGLSRCVPCLPGGSTRWASSLSWKAAMATRKAGTSRP